MLDKLFLILRENGALKEMKHILTQVDDIIENLDDIIIDDPKIKNDAIDCIVEILQNLKQKKEGTDAQEKSTH